MWGLPGPPSDPPWGWLGPHRLGVTRCHVCRTEIFSGKSVAHEDIQYEQACILYNLGERPPPAAGAGQWADAGKSPVFGPPLPATPLPAPLFWATGSHCWGEAGWAAAPVGPAAGMAAPDPLWLWALPAEGTQVGLSSSALS